MFCSNCGNKLNEEEKFCSNCGTPVVSVTLTEKISLKNPLKPFFKKAKEIILKHKKPIFFSGIIAFVVILGFTLFMNLYDFTKLSWNVDMPSYSVEYTLPSQLDLEVIAIDKKKNPIDEITFTCTGGEIKVEGRKVTWTLPKEEGTYQIYAQTPSGKKIHKEVNVVTLDRETNLTGVYEEPVDDETADNDNDGLSNAKEKELGTNPNLADTDGDGLSDYYEINISKTDPLKMDTDNDGIKDGDELDLGLDPLKEDSKQDGIKDGDRTLTYTVDNSGIQIEITGKGNIASTTIDIFKNTTFQNMTGVLDKIYNFYSIGTIEEAIVTIPYDLEEIQKQGLDETNLTLYYFDDKDKKLEEIPTTVDKAKKTLTVTLKHFSKYVIGDNKQVVTNKDTEVLFVIDNSVSMYTEQQLKEAGYGESTGAIGNDSDFKRLTLTNSMIEKITGNYQFSIAEFSGNYIKLQSFTQDRNKLKEAVEKMRLKFNSYANGTDIITALNKGIAEFSKDDKSHYLLLLTDGKNTSGRLEYSKSSIISNAKNKDVKVCIIGLGNNVDSEVLEQIAVETGCDYYPANNAMALEEIYALMAADINYSYVDTNNDNKVDGMIVADSGFIVTRDGFSFNNYVTNKSRGNCYGMATFAMLYYTKTLPLSLSNLDASTLFMRDMKSDGYDLKNTYFASYKNLYQYQFNNEVLKTILNPPSDLRDRIENDTWLIKDSYYEKLEEIGTKFELYDYNGTKYSFKSYQQPIIDIDSDVFKKNVSKDDQQLLNAIWRFFILQTKDHKESFLASPDKAFTSLNKELESGNPVVVTTSNHALNAIRLIQDINDANHFKLEIYDNNFNGETRYIDIVRTKYNKIQLNFTAWTNEYQYKIQYDQDNNGEMEEVKLTVRDISKLLES